MSGIDWINTIQQSIHELFTNYSELHISTVNRLDQLPGALQFYRSYVSCNIPCILSNLCNSWLVSHWNILYLRQLIGNTVISVSITPNGLADSILSCTRNHTKYFVTPYTVSMCYNQFVDLVDHTSNAVHCRYYIPNAIYYAQQQNNCFNTEYSTLHQYISESKLMNDVFDTPPDAVNLWIGNALSVSSLHRDMYENIYSVVSGRKIFYLYPPVSYHYLQFSYYHTAQFVPKRLITDPSLPYIELTDERYSEWCILPDINNSRIPWSDWDASKYDASIHSIHLKPLTVTLYPGDTLYLPSQWYHQVHQSDDTIAINYWYDMKYDIKYCYSEFMKSISHIQQHNK